MVKEIFLLLVVVMGCKSISPKDSPEDEFVVAFGSCNHQWDPQTIWAEVIKNDPDLWMWTGDIVYADTEDMDKLNRDYNHLKSTPGYQNLLLQCPVVGVWDDHDYGANNAGKDYPKKDESKEALFRFLDVSVDNPAGQRPGAYQSYDYVHKDVQIKLILLDVRYFRDDIGTAGGTILGEEQWKWLDQETHSDADLTIIAGGIQFLHTEHRFEKWYNYPQEYQKLLDLIDRNDSSNVILISGDRHIGEIAQYSYPDGQVIHEVTASGLTHSYEKSTETNSLRVGPLIKTINFGILRISEDLVHLELHNQHNQVVSHHEIQLE